MRKIRAARGRLLVVEGGGADRGQDDGGRARADRRARQLRRARDGSAARTSRRSSAGSRKSRGISRDDVRARDRGAASRSGASRPRTTSRTRRVLRLAVVAGRHRPDARRQRRRILRRDARRPRGSRPSPARRQVSAGRSRSRSASSAGRSRSARGASSSSRRRRSSSTTRAARAVVHPLDVTDPGVGRRVLRVRDAEAGPIDVLVNNAGTALPGDVHEMSDDDHRAHRRDRTCSGPILLTQPRRARACATRGATRATSCSSRRTRQRTRGRRSATYVATKAGLEAFAATLALELEGVGVALVGRAGRSDARPASPTTGT